MSLAGLAKNLSLLAYTALLWNRMCLWKSNTYSTKWLINHQNPKFSVFQYKQEEQQGGIMSNAHIHHSYRNKFLHAMLN